MTTPTPVRSDGRRFVVRTLVGLLAVAMVVLWVYAFLLAPSGNPDRLQDRAWPEAAQKRCLEARAVIDTLPSAAQATLASPPVQPRPACCQLSLFGIFFKS